MDCVKNQNVNRNPNCETDASVISCEITSANCFLNRAVRKSAQSDARRQIEREAETRKLDPAAYRLSNLSQAAMNGCYRRGKDSMSSDDVLRYFAENRNRYLQTACMDGNTGIDECVSDPITKRSLILASDEPKKTGLVARAGSLAVSAKARFSVARREWWDFSRADSSKETRRFPISALAALLAIAMSMMLIVASSILVTNGESGVSNLKKEIDVTSGELAKLRSDFEVQNDLLEIRRIAVEEYGMVSKDFLKAESIELATEDTVESFDADTKENVGFAALLSAIGIK